MDISASDQEILGFIEDWVGLLAQGNYQGAYDHTSHDPYYQWTPKLIEQVIDGYGLPEPHPSGEHFVVTPSGAANGTPGSKTVERGKGIGNTIGHVYYDLPLNGEWSDLTASFRLEQHGKKLAVVLEEIHVM